MGDLFRSDFHLYKAPLGSVRAGTIQPSDGRESEMCVLCLCIFAFPVNKQHKNHNKKEKLRPFRDVLWTRTDRRGQMGVCVGVGKKTTILFYHQLSHAYARLFAKCFRLVDGLDG